MVSLGRIAGTVSIGRLPDTIIGGAPRSGTTFVCELLAKHPDVYVARPFIPEPKVCMMPAPEGDDGFRRRYADLFAGAPESAMLVEKTSYYFENEQARERLVRLLPGAKFVFILREPASRAYSNWLWSRKNGLENLSFADAIALDGKRPNPLLPEREYARPFDYLSRGRYGTLAKAWIGDVGPERISFYIFEEVLANPERFTTHLQNFLGISELAWSKLVTGRINATEPDGGLDPQIANTLRQQFQPEVELLAALTGLDVSVWNY